MPSKYIPFTDEQKLTANSTDLVEYLRGQGESLKREGLQYAWPKYPGLMIHGNQWYSHYDQKGGYPVSFLQKFFNLSYTEAVTELLGGGAIQIAAEYQPQQKEKKKFCLPQANDEMHHIYAYLIKQRFLERDIITHFVQAGMLYEDMRHNAVFIGMDKDGQAQYAHKRGTIPGVSYRMDVAGSDKRFGFCYKGTSDRLYVFEAPIDMLSFLTLYQENWQEHSYVALGGVGEHAMLEVLSQNAKLREVHICTDHDVGGIEAAERLADILHQQNYTAFRLLPPKFKDWNEMLKAEHGLEAIPAEDHPMLISMRELCRTLAVESPDTIRPYRKLFNLCEQYLDTHNPALLYPAAKAALFCVQDQFEKMGTPVSTKQVANYLCRCYRPYKDKGGQTVRDSQMRKLLAELHSSMSVNGVYTNEQRKELAAMLLKTGSQCLQNQIFHDQQQPPEQLREAVSLSM